VSYYVLVFLAGFAGSFHCIGMCGGFACALGHDRRGAGATMARHLVYNVGRLTSYCFIGALAGTVGQVICTSQGMSVTTLNGSFDIARRLLAIAAGLLMIVMALSLFGMRLKAVGMAGGFFGGALAGSLRNLMASANPAAPLALGVFNGFLPCPLVYAVAAQAASTATALSGILVMAAFGLGTFPALLTMGGLGHLLAPTWRHRGVRLAGGFILLLGLLTIGRGVLPTGLHPGHPA
jgi:uncharacterized protein